MLRVLTDGTRGSITTEVLTLMLGRVALRLRGSKSRYRGGEI